jgi:hypothetical protein
MSSMFLISMVFDLIGMLSRVFEVLRIRGEMLLESYQPDTLGQVRVTLQHPLPSCGYLFMGGLILGGLVL